MNLTYKQKSKTLINPRLQIQTIKTDSDVLKFMCPFAMTISGPSQAGKSEFLYQMVKFREQVCTATFHRIIYCQSNSYSQKNQEFFKRLQELFPQLEIHQGLPNLTELQLNMNNLHSLLLVDDLMDPIMKSNDMVELVSKDVHNFNISVIFVLQNYFATSKHGKTLTRNCQYKVFFYNRIELLELRNISSQIAAAPNFLAANFHFLMSNFPDEKFPYLIIDGHSKSKAGDFPYRSRIFPINDKIEPIIFYPNPDYKK